MIKLHYYRRRFLLNSRKSTKISFSWTFLAPNRAAILLPKVATNSLFSSMGISPVAAKGRKQPIIFPLLVTITISPLRVNPEIPLRNCRMDANFIRTTSFDTLKGNTLPYLCQVFCTQKPFLPGKGEEAFLTKAL